MTLQYYATGPSAPKIAVRGMQGRDATFSAFDYIISGGGPRRSLAACGCALLLPLSCCAIGLPVTLLAHILAALCHLTM